MGLTDVMSSGIKKRRAGNVSRLEKSKATWRKVDTNQQKAENKRRIWKRQNLNQRQTNHSRIVRNSIDIVVGRFLFAIKV